MIYRFGGYELDEAQRELRLQGRELALQPKVFDLLLYLVRNRDRVISKNELLDTLWADTIVADGALQRAMSLVRAALQPGGAHDSIRTFARHGYRFCAPVAGDEAAAGGDTPADLQGARRAYEESGWDLAIDAFQEADRSVGLAAADLERWAHAAQCAGREPEALGPLERAVAAHAIAGDRRGAARAALMLAQILAERRDLAVARGWHKRAASYLVGLEEGREHGLLEWLGSRMAAVDGDLPEALRRAARTVALGRQLPDPDLEALGLLYEGLWRLAQGDVQAGTALQDEAGAAALAGTVSPWVGGTVYCGIIWGCRNRVDWQRAAQWTEQYTRWCERSRLAGYPGLCRLHRAELLSVVGDLEQAECELEEACRQLAANAPWAEGDAYRVLGDLRLGAGDLAAADAAFRRAYELGWDPQPGLALLHLTQGRPAAAVRGLERSLQDQRWVNGQRRGLLLAHLAIAAAYAGDADRARRVLLELEAQPELCASPALAATRARARAEVALAEERRDEAITGLREGLRQWQEIGAPLNSAALRLRLAELLVADGDLEGADLEVGAAEAAFRQAGATPALQRCATLRRSLGLGG
jgi:DNA-binding winged helix-turn-helix (wHTH) protein